MSQVSAMVKALRAAARMLAEAEIWIVGGAVAVSIVLPRFLAAAVITAAAFFVVRWLATGQPSVRTPADWPIAILALLSAANWMWVTALPEITSVHVLRLWSGIGLYYSVVNWIDRESRLRWLTRGLLLAGLLLGAAAPFSVDWATGKLPIIPEALYSHFQVLVADTIHSNVLGGTLALILPVGIAIWLFGGVSGWERWLALAAAAVMGGVMLLSLSRGALLAVGAAGIGLLILRGRWGWLALAAAAAAAGYIVYRFGLNRVFDLALSGGAVSGLDGRMEIWSRAWYMIQDFAFTGVGMGCFDPVSDKLYPMASYAPETNLFHAHNIFLEIGATLGIPGLLAWTAVLVTSLVAAWQTYRTGRRQGNSLLAGLGAGLLGCQVALVVHGMMDAAALVRPVPLVWLIWGLAMAGKAVGSQKSVVESQATEVEGERTPEDLEQVPG